MTTVFADYCSYG